jgi:class 3 adenylate cyclase/tetratricopeptide (TPR) repeat protein
LACPTCGAENRPGNKFCKQCGAALARRCVQCASPLDPDSSFCGECGSAQSPGASNVVVSAPLGPAQRAATAERRVVSVLFADLVGFTPLSESRDAEEVRELLTRYFETCRALITRYGGMVEKFIGDAVMAVWGAPVAHEDDAERAVRAALDLVEAVAVMGTEIGMPDLRARAGVLTGDAAVTLGAESQGMVAGDLVNTASRIQAEARPGTVVVGDATREATEAAVVYEDLGDRTLKGKAEPVRLWEARRVVALVGGALKSEGLEAPFMGRDRELRLMKDLFHGSSEDHKAHLVSVVGIAGIGKSRLSWEFFKYLDGIATLNYTHRGRCLAYGEGVTYWALAEMVRMRARITEAEDPGSARAKLQACLAEYVPDAEERRWIEPRLAQLLALEDHAIQERQDLFSAWRLFFERLAAKAPTVLLFEDMQWADTSLLDFIEYLLEWSRNHALYVVTLARPELVERHPTWGAGKRNFTSVFLEPLPAPAMEQLLDGLVPGLPDELREQILVRAEGVPLYAVETVRMLLDRGLLERQGGVYRLTGPVEDLAVPQSLQGLISARLDGLRPEARRALQDAAVLGKTFTLESLAAISAVPADQLGPVLAELVRKEVLSVQMDPRSPERGQYGFLQDLVKRVAYETLSKRDRKEKHLAVATWFESSWGGEERDVVEVVASHYLEAFNLAPQDPDADVVKERAADVLFQAGERAASLAANAEAERYFQKAAELVGAPIRQAELLDHAGEAAWKTGRADAASQQWERSIAIYESEGKSHAAARVSAALGRVEASRGHIDQALERMERAYVVLANDPPDADLAILADGLGALHLMAGDREKAMRLNEKALDIAEALRLPEMLSQALNTKAAILATGHAEEALALFEHALKLALDNSLHSAALRAYNNLANAYNSGDRYRDGLPLLRDLLALARKVGDRVSELSTVGELTYVLMQLGEWDEATELASSIPESELHEAGGELLSLVTFAETYVHRGQLQESKKLISTFERMATSDDVQERGSYLAARACLLRGTGNFGDALSDAEEAVAAALEVFGPQHQAVKSAIVEAVESAFSLGDYAKVRDLVAWIDALRPGERPQYLRGQAARFRGRLGSIGDPGVVEPAFIEAAEIFSQIGMPFWLAVTQLEHAEWLMANGRDAEAGHLLGDAAATFERLQARPWLDRTRQSAPAAGVAS